MMNPQRRTLLITRLINAIETMGSGPVFERFGVLLIKHLTGTDIVQRGSSVSGSPVGRAVDGLSEDGSVAVETSVLQEYFSGGLQKPADDLKHVLDLCPNAQQIYLLCSRRAPAKAVERFVAAAVKDPAMAGRTIHLLDNRAIAEKIVDCLLEQDNAVDDLSAILPALLEIRDDFAATHLVPAVEAGHIHRTGVTEELDRRFSGSRCVVISGIGGIGKSQAAAAYARANQSAYPYVLWLDARDIHNMSLLSATPYSRGGMDRNVLGLLRNKKCLLILDDAPDQLSADVIALECGPDARVIITRRGSEGDTYALPMLDEAAARELLERGLPDGTVDGVFPAAWRTVGGHPLSLRLLNAALRAGTPPADMLEDLKIVGQFVDSGELLAERVLGRLRPILTRELSVFAWAQEKSCDRSFLRSAIGPAGLRKLSDFGLITASGPSSVSIHDIVYAALSGGDWLTEQRQHELDDALDEYLKTIIRSDEFGLHSAAVHLKRRLIKAIRDGNRRPAFALALIAAWSAADVQPALLPDPVGFARTLEGSSGASVDIEILLAIESLEALHRYERHVNGRDKGLDWLREHMDAFDILGSLDDLADRQKAEIKHHRAKALRLLHQHDQARSLFEEVISEFPLNEAKLQLVRMYGNDPAKVKDAENLAREIIDAFKKNDGVSISVFLGLADALNWAHDRWATDLFDENEETFLNQALNGAGANIPQAYEVLATFARKRAWSKPHTFAELVAQLPEPPPLLLEDDRSQGAFAEIMYLAAVRIDAGKFAPLALFAYESMRSPDPFARRRWADTLLLLDRYEEAERLLAAIDDKPSRIFVAHSLSRAVLGLGRAEEALALSDEAIEGAVGKYTTFRCSFLIQRIKTKLALGQDPFSDIDEALRLAENDRQHEELDVLRKRASGST